MNKATMLSREAVGHRKFTEAEDQSLLYYVKTFGTKNWNIISQMMSSGRTARQCRERFKYYLDPLKGKAEGPWSQEEDDLLIQKYGEFGPKWAFISSFFPGRTDINMKNRYHRLLRNNNRNTKFNGLNPFLIASSPSSNPGSDSDPDSRTGKKREMLMFPAPLSLLLGFK